MSNVQALKAELKGIIEPLDLDLIISHALDKPREFVLAHPEKNLTQNQESRIKRLIRRRIKNEPLAYILGYKEFYGLDFKVNKHTLIPRPETELLIDLVLKNHLTIQQLNHLTILDIGTGSGNIIISIVKNFYDCHPELDSGSNLKPSLRFRTESGMTSGINFCATDISQKALRVAKQNAKYHKVDKKINFFQSDLLSSEKLINHLTIQPFSYLTILANLPYLSRKIYDNSPSDVRDYEPESALLSSLEGLSHYEKLLKQLKALLADWHLLGPQALFGTICYFEISPEQKTPLARLVRDILPGAKTDFHKDLSGRWRICRIVL